MQAYKLLLVKFTKHFYIYMEENYVGSPLPYFLDETKENNTPRILKFVL